MSRPKPSSAINGRLPQGPTTDAGKNRTRFNALTHGLSAKRSVLLTCESEEAFEPFEKAYKQQLEIDGPVEETLAVTMIVAQWRLLRARNIETVAMEEAIRQMPAGVSSADVLFSLMDDRRFVALNRYEASLSVQFQRSLNALLKLRQHFPATRKQQDESSLTGKAIFDQILATAA